jgi:hypothetical protein
VEIPRSIGPRKSTIIPPTMARVEDPNSAAKKREIRIVSMFVATEKGICQIKNIA